MNSSPEDADMKKKAAANFSWRERINDAGLFTIRETDPAILSFLKKSVNYAMFGFVMFMTGIVWLVTVLVV